MIRRTLLFALALCALAALPAPAGAAEGNCELTPRYKCFGIGSVSASLSTHQAGAHPDVTLDAAVLQDPESKPNVFGLEDSFSPTKNLRFETPPGLIGDPNSLGATQQCTVTGLLSAVEEGGEGCPNGSQIGVSVIYAHLLTLPLREPVYMMVPPGGDVVARLGVIAGTFPTLIDLHVRSGSDYGLTAEVVGATSQQDLVALETTLWGVPAAEAHDTERCKPSEILHEGCLASEARHPSGRVLPFLTNPTRCGVPLEVSVGAASWAEPERFDFKSASLGQITGCDKLPFGPSMELEPTSHKAASPTGANVTIRLPASSGVEVLEPSQIRDISVKLPAGFAFNPSAGDGLETCSPSQVGLGTSEPSHCPDGAKLADTEFDIPVLERNLRGAVYLREPEPGHPFRIWVTADDLGLHVKLGGELEVDKQSGQITEITTEIPQAPLREARLAFKSGFRAPLVTPEKCGTYRAEYEFAPWSGGPSVSGTAPMKVTEGCDTGGFNPRLSAGTTDPAAGKHSPFLFTLTRQDGEQNPASLDITLPTGLAATFAGIPRCDGVDAVTGNCPPASRIGSVTAAVGAGQTPLWVPQPGKRPTAVYLGGPYKGGPLSIVAVVPKQAGPFDFGDEVVRSAVYVDPVTAQATVRSDPFPQLIEGIPIGYRTLHVAVDRPGFTLNPTGCAAKQVEAAVHSASGAIAHPSSPFSAVNCAALGFKPHLGLKLKGGTKRGSFPALKAVFRPRAGDANPKEIVVRLPHSAFLEQGHFRTICTRVQYAANGGGGAGCPPESAYGHVTAYTPLLETPLEGPVYLRSSNHNLPDMVMSLHGPPSLPIQIEAVGRIDSVKGGIRSSFEAVPDAPLTAVVLEMEGGKKGLIVNSTNLCKGTHRADVDLAAHNGRSDVLHPEMKATGCKQHRKKHHKRHRRNAHG